MKRKTIILASIALLVLISISAISAANRKSMKVLVGSSKNWEVHIYMQKSTLTTVTVLPLGDVKKLPDSLSTVIECSDASAGTLYQNIPFISGNTYEAQFSTEKALYQHSNTLQFVILQEGGDETIALSKDKAY